MENKTIINEYRLHIRGLFGRNRKAKFDSFTLVEKPIADAMLTDDELKALIRSKLVEIKAKTGSVKVLVNEVTLENDSGVMIRSFQLFNDKTVATTTVEEALK